MIVIDGIRTMNYRIRRATGEDLERLIDFVVMEAQEAEGITKNPATVREGILTGLMDESVALYWVLEDAQRVIGNVSVVKEWSDWNAGYYWWIQSIFIEPNYRGQGLAKMLLRAVQDAAQEQQALELRLYVHQENRRAIQTYLKAGFEDTPYCIMRLAIHS